MSVRRYVATIQSVDSINHKTKLVTALVTTSDYGIHDWLVSPDFYSFISKNCMPCGSYGLVYCEPFDGTWIGPVPFYDFEVSGDFYSLTLREFSDLMERNKAAHTKSSIVRP